MKIIKNELSEKKRVKKSFRRCSFCVVIKVLIIFNNYINNMYNDEQNDVFLANNK